MDTDFTSPAARHFKDANYHVREGVPGEEAILWMSFGFGDEYLNLAVYDYKDRTGYTHEFKGKTAAEVDAFIESVERDYGTKVPNNFKTLPKKYLTIMGASFAVHAELDEEYTYCETCGDTNGSTLAAFYFPAISKNLPASVGLSWNYGCYGGEAISGTVDCLDGVVEALNRAIETAEVQSAADEVVEFRDRLVKTFADSK